MDISRVKWDDEIDPVKPKKPDLGTIEDLGPIQESADVSGKVVSEQEIVPDEGAPIVAPDGTEIRPDVGAEIKPPEQTGSSQPKAKQALKRFSERKSFIPVDKIPGDNLTADEFLDKEDDEIEYVKSGKWYEVNRIAKSKESRKKHLLECSGGTFLPPVITLILGAGVMWVFSGFVPKQNK
jgi:hypothetical protein